MRNGDTIRITRVINWDLYLCGLPLFPAMGTPEKLIGACYFVNDWSAHRVVQSEREINKTVSTKTWEEVRRLSGLSSHTLRERTGFTFAANKG
jgi:hypothetical protein